MDKFLVQMEAKGVLTGVISDLEDRIFNMEQNVKTEETKEERIEKLKQHVKSCNYAIYCINNMFDNELKEDGK